VRSICRKFAVEVAHDWQRKELAVRLPVTFGAIFALVLVTGCGGGGAPAPTTPGPSAPGPTAAGPTPTEAAAAIVCNASGEGGAVDISNFAFNPSSVTVATGGSVIFTNNDGTAHTVTFDSGPDCGNIAGGGAQQTVQFTVAGSYAYHCRIHPSMKGTVVAN
jgi:plastocyanin